MSTATGRTDRIEWPEPLDPPTGTGRSDRRPDLDPVRRLVAEGLGTAFLLIAVVGSGISASRLSPDDLGLQLLQNAATTAGALIGIILMISSVSGAHLNPVVTLVERLQGSMSTGEAVLYAVAQVFGACLGTVIANVMFEMPAIELSTTDRASGGLWLSEVVATAGLLLVITGCIRAGRATAVPYAVGAWIGAASWSTSSTSFANPAATIARALSDSFAGITLASVPAFIAMQLIGAGLAYGLIVLLHPPPALPDRPDPTPQEIP